MIGKTLSHYRILSELGSGGMGVVYLAHDERLQRDVAIKLLPLESTTDELARRRLIREAQVASQLNHPHICTIHEIGDAEGVVFIAMEQIEGRSLEAVVGARGLPFDAILRYGAQIADALAYAHEHGVVHRDLKCANVLVTTDSRIKVLDFGLAKRMSPSEADATARMSHQLTGTGAIVGTLHAMPPEVLRGEPADERSDLWALGVVLYQMASGLQPFRGANEIELGASILHSPPEPLPARVPAGLAAIILRCLAKDPAQRYRQAGEVRAALEGLMTGSTAGAAPVAAEVPKPATRGSRALWLGVAGIALLLVVTAALFDAGGWRTRLFGGRSVQRISSLAVLPLDNFSRDPEQEYFANGMTEELITSLAQLGGLRVISRTSVMRFRGTKLSLPEIGRQLGADAIVEGSVQRSGDRVRITAQLIRAATDQHIWAQTYERDVQDVLALQDEVAGAIAREVQAQLTPGQQHRIDTGASVSAKSYELYLRALDAYRRWDRQGAGAAVEFLQQALRNDSTYAPAWAALGQVYIDGYGSFGPRDEVVARARVAVERALVLDPRLGLAHSAKALILFQQEWKWAAAEQEFRRAIQLSPSSFEAHHMYSHLLMDLGRAEESLVQSRSALALDPLNTAATLHMGWQHLFSGHYEAALREYDATLRLDPSYSAAYSQMAEALMLSGRLDEAAAAWRKRLELTPSPDSLAFSAVLASRRGRTAEASALASALIAGANRGEQDAYDVADVLAELGRVDEAFLWLDRSLAAHEASITSLKIDPILAPLRRDPRFAALLRRIGLPT